MQIKLVNTKKYCLHAGLKKKPNNNKDQKPQTKPTNQQQNHLITILENTYI